MQLDPITNLPQKENTKESQRRALEAYTKTRQRTGASFGGSSPVQGTFGTYKPGQMVTSDRNFNELRAVDQGGWEKFGKTLATTVGGTVVGGLVSAVGFLGDMPEYIANMAATEDGISIQPFERNAVSQLGGAIENHFRDNFEVYQTERAQSGNLNPFSSESRLRDSTYWAAMVPSIATTVPLMFTGGGAAFAVARGLKALGAGAKTQRLASALSASVVSRHTENMMEGFETMESRIEELQSQGFDYLSAKEEATKTASDIYKRGYINLWLDMASWGGLLRGVNYASRNATDAVKALDAVDGGDIVKNVQKVFKRNPNLTLKEGVERAGYSWKDWVGQSALEGLEEFNIQLQKHLSIRNSDILLGLKEGEVTGFLESFVNGDAIDLLRNDKETQDAVLMGFLAGGVFQGIGQGYTAFENRRNIESITAQGKALSDQIEFINEQLNVIEKAAISGNTEAATLAEEKLITKLAFSGVKLSEGVHQGSLLQGDTANNIEMFEAIANMTDEELVAIGRENPKEAREQAKRTADKIRRVAEIFNKNADKYSNGFQDTILNVFLTEQQFMNESAVERSERINKKLDDFYNNEILQAASKQLTPEQFNEAKLRAELFALEKVKKDKGELSLGDITKNQLNAFRFNMLKRTREVAVKDLDKKIEAIKEQLPEKQSPEIKEFVKTHLKDDTHNNLQAEKAYNNFMLVEGEATLADYVKSSTREEILQALQTSSEKIKDQIAEFAVSKEAVNGSFISSEDKLFQVRREDDSIFLTEYDTKTESLKGEEKRFSRDLFKDDNFQVLSPETVITEESREATSKAVNTAVSEGNFESAVRDLNKLYFSGMTASYNEAKEKLKDKIRERIKKESNLVDMQNLFFELSSNNQELQTELTDILEKEFESLQKSIQNERAKLFKAFGDSQAKLNQLQEAISSIKTIIKNLKKDQEGLETSVLKTRLGDKYTEILSERDVEIANLKETGATTPEINKVRAEYKQRLQNELNAILEADLEIAATIKQQKVATEKTIKEKKELAKSLRAQESEISRYIEEYERLINSIPDGQSPLLYVQEKSKGINLRIEEIKVQIFNDIDYSLPQLRAKLRNSEDKLLQAVAVLEEYDKDLAELSESNIVVKRARNEAMAELFSRGITPDMLNNPAENLVNLYKKLLREKLTKRLTSGHSDKTKKLANKIFEKLKEDTSINLDIDRTISDVGLEAVKNMNDSLNNLVDYLKELQELQTTQVILQKIFDGVDSAIFDTLVDEDTPTSFTPKRTLETYKTRLTGFDHSSVDGKSQLTSDEAQIRYSQFVNQQNIAVNPVQIKMVTVDQIEQMGVIVDPKVKEQYQKNGVSMLYAIITREGKYLDMNGNPMDDFDPNVSIYTSFPSAENSILEFADDEIYLKNRYPDLKTQEQRIEQYKKDIAQRESEHATFVSDIVDRLAKGEDVFIESSGKSVGIEITADKRGYDEGFTPKPLTDIIGNPNFELHLSVTGNITTSDNQIFPVGKGKMVAYDKTTGNLFKVSRRRVSEAEVNTFIEVLQLIAEQQKVSGKKVSGDLLKEVIDKSEDAVPINIIQLKRHLFGDLVDVNIAKNSITVSNSKNKKSKISFPIFKTEEGGKLLNEFANTTGLKETLSNLLHNVNTDPGKDVFVTYSIKEGKAEVKEYSPSPDAAKSAYEVYLIAEKVVGSRNAPRTKLPLMGETGMQISSYQFMNQNINFVNPYIKQLESSEVKETSTSSPLREQIFQSLKQKISDKKQAEILPRFYEFYAEVYNEFTDYNNRTQKDDKVLAELYKKIQEYDKETLGETLSAANSGKNMSMQRYDYIKNWIEAHESYLDILLDIDVEIEDAATIAERSLEPDFVVPLDDASSQAEAELNSAPKETKGFSVTKKPPSTDVSDVIDFQLSTDTRQMSPAEVSKVSQNLTNRTGVKTVIFNSLQARDFLEFLYESGELSESFEGKTLPHGMFRNGVAYIFSDARVDTPFHEVLHPIITQILNDNVELANNLVDSIKDNPNYSSIYTKVLQEYPGSVQNGEVTTQAIAEVLTTIAGLEAAKAYDAQSMLGRIWEQIKQFFRDVIGADPITIESISPNTTLAELGNILGATQRKIAVVTNLRTNVYQKPDFQVPNLNNVKTKSNKYLSEIGFTPKDWYILTTSERNAILECN